MSEITVREVTDEDLLRLGIISGVDYWGKLGERNGAIIGFALAVWLDDIPELTFQQLSTGATLKNIGLASRRFMRLAPFNACVARCDALRKPKAGRWLAALKFEPTDEYCAQTGMRYWAWRRSHQ